MQLLIPIIHIPQLFTVISLAQPNQITIGHITSDAGREGKSYSERFNGLK